MKRPDTTSLEVGGMEEKYVECAFVDCSNLFEPKRSHQRFCRTRCQKRFHEVKKTMERRHRDSLKMKEKPVMSDVDIAWIAGIIEGEGAFTVQPKEDSVKLYVSMSDKDILDRLQMITQSGAVSQREKRKLHYKQMWVWQVGNRREVARIMCAIAPLMGARRRERILECAETLLQRMHDPNRRMW